MKSAPSTARETVRTSRLLTAETSSPFAVAHAGRLCGLAFLLLLAAAEAQSQQTAGETYNAPRTPFGQPDLQASCRC